MISLQQSNILEVLAESLAARLGDVAGDPLSAQLVVVPNPGMGRWLSHYLATRDGVVANLEFLTPGPFFWRVLRAWLPGQEESLFDSSSLQWRIHAKLPALLEKPVFAELKHYIDGIDPGLRLFQLSQRIADSFDQYLVYRPEMVLAWEDGKDSHWQAQLWRSLTEAENNHRARLLQRLAVAMQQAPQYPEILPNRVSFFGLNALAPVYMGILKQLGQYSDISISHLNLSADYWADIRSEKSQLRRARAFAEDGDPFAAFLDLGNPLLASMGHIGQAYLDQLLELDGTAEDDFREPLAEGILHGVQKDILQLEDGRLNGREFLEETWPSIQLHGTHTPWREVQVLQDNLLRCFDELEDLKPREILVMAPNMAAYVPLIEAVFDNAEKSQKIPFSIADRAQGADSALAEAVRYLLKLPESRLSANDIVALLEVKALQQRFGLETHDLQRIRTWVHESGIRWAADAAHRIDLGLPGDAGLHSWQFGLQ
ncbi:MAG: exodeoxyribonuclease V subunit gamma, partial [Xanthomonadales bacterium]|nr:exodeoxyribonuclease V subunit gamma [Xanthomonadales bacterium]